MPLPKTEWDAKFLREQPFMAFGSMCNAYGLVNKGIGGDAETFLKVMDMLWDKANEFTQRNFDKVEEIKENAEEQSFEEQV